ncbi:DUF2848 family protein [Alkalibacillus aidingensis]|uniref:DUF2848 family protein n=1 Tax=Alkalibacillus aidingensis TaxID=2747607 RepID=UPI00166042E1|nr:DUF2848 family protein [Alkalibacillus aidingensis]
MHNQYSVEVEGNDRIFTLNHAYCVGYTGRDKEKTLEHVAELKEIGVPEPEEIPTLFPVSQTSLIQGGTMQVIGNQTSGEAEIVFIFGESPDDVYVTVGSDHTDRELETVDINKSKQVCDKPFARKAWKLSDIKDHWDELELTSEILVNGQWVNYQKHKVSAILPIEEIFDYLKGKQIEFKNSIVFAGTVPLLDGFKFGQEFHMSFNDPIRNDQISTSYKIINLRED